jgi:hypothetical protein
MTVGTTFTLRLRASLKRSCHSDEETFIASFSVPSDFTVYPKGFTSVSWERCSSASAVPFAVAQYGIQPENSRVEDVVFFFEEAASAVGANELIRMSASMTAALRDENEGTVRVI